MQTYFFIKINTSIKTVWAAHDDDDHMQSYTCIYLRIMGFDIMYEDPQRDDFRWEMLTLIG